MKKTFTEDRLELAINHTVNDAKRLFPAHVSMVAWASVSIRAWLLADEGPIKIGSPYDHMPKQPLHSDPWTCSHCGTVSTWGQKEYHQKNCVPYLCRDVKPAPALTAIEEVDRRLRLEEKHKIKRAQPRKPKATYKCWKCQRQIPVSHRGPHSDVCKVRIGGKE